MQGSSIKLPSRTKTATAVPTNGVFAGSGVKNLDVPSSSQKSIDAPNSALTSGSFASNIPGYAAPAVIPSVSNPYASKRDGYYDSKLSEWEESKVSVSISFPVLNYVRVIYILPISAY